MARNEVKIVLKRQFVEDEVVDETPKDPFPFAAVGGVAR